LQSVPDLSAFQPADPVVFPSVGFLT